MLLSDTDRDLMIRTVAGEAGGRSDQGKAVVAHAILNRLNTGEFGDDISSVVLARDQFDSWQTRARELSALSPQSSQYKQAAKVVDSVVAGAAPDPTNGSTHAGDDSMFIDSGFAMPKRQLPPPKGSQAQSPDMFEAAGFKLPDANKPTATTAAPAPARNADLPPGATGTLQIPGGPTLYVDAQGKFVTPPEPTDNRSALERVHAALSRYDPFSPRNLGIGDPVAATAEAYNSANALRASGMADIRSGNYLPSRTGTTQSVITDLSGNRRPVDTQAWSAGGLLKTAGGALGIPLSPLSGTMNALVEQPATYLTGNPAFGEKASFLAGSGVPVTGGVRAALPSTRATNALVNVIGPENVPGVVNRLASNPRLSIMDVSDPVRLRMQGVYADAEQPAAQNVISQAVRSRMESRPAAANSAYTAAMGPNPNVVNLLAELKQRARDVGEKEIQPALENAKPVDVGPVIAAIDEKLKPGITALATPGLNLPLNQTEQALVRLKSQLTDGRSVLFDPQRLHRIQSATGDMAYQYGKSLDADQKLAGGALRDINEQLIDQIDAAAGGKYRPARARFKDAKDVQEAFDSGFDGDVLKNRPGHIEDRPEAFQQWMATASPEQIEAKQLGTRAEIDRRMRGVKNQALAGQTIAKIEYNQEKLRMLFGDDETNRLIRVMRDSEDEAETNAKMIAGAKTAETTSGRQSMQLPPAKPFGVVSPTNALLGPTLGEVAAQYMGMTPGLTAGTMLAGGVGLGALGKAANILARRSAANRNIAFARAASATGDQRLATINALMTHPQVVRQLQKSSNPLALP